MNFKFLFTLLLSFQYLIGYSQSNFVITGKVSNGTEPLEDAEIQVLNTGISVFTTGNGTYSIASIPSGSYRALITAFGYASKTVEFTVTGNTELNIQLRSSVSQLEEVVVSAEKREDLLQRVPVSVSVINAKKVLEYRLWNARDITGIVPNLYSSSPGDNRNVTSIRGITTTSYDPAIATYVDGVNQFSLDTYIPDLLDIERIEVLRGPQGTLYGRNAMGGVINIITRKPGNQPSGFAEMSIGNYGRQRYTAGLRTALIKDKLYAGVAGVYNKSGGIYTNEFNNTAFDRQHSGTGNYYLRYLPSSAWSLTLNVKHHNNRNQGPFTLVNGVEEALANPFKVNQNTITNMIDNSLNASLAINYAGSSVNFASLTAYQRNQRYYMDPIDADFSPADIVKLINDYGKDWNNVKAYTQEFRFSSSVRPGDKLQWTAGTFLFLQDNPVKQTTRFGNDGPIFNAPQNASIINTNDGKGYGVAGFGQLTYEVSDKLDLTAGLRYDKEWKELTILGEYQQDPDPQIMIIVPQASGKADFSALSPKLGLAYELSTESHSFLTYTRGYRVGGLTQLGSDAQSVPPLYAFDPEYSNNFELGIKNTFHDNRLRLNASIFYTAVTDAQVPTLVLPDAITITRNAGNLNSKGIELEIAAIPAKNLVIDYNAGYTDAKYKSLRVAQEGTEVNLDGKRQVFTPQYSSVLAIQQGFELGGKQNFALVARGELFLIGKQFFDLNNTIKQDGYSTLNFRAGVTSNYAELFFWVRNATDKLYIDYAYDFGAVKLADPRTYGFTIRARF